MKIGLEKRLRNINLEFELEAGNHFMCICISTMSFKIIQKLGLKSNYPTFFHKHTAVYAFWNLMVPKCY